LILEYADENSEMIANFVQSKTTAKATLWMWHLRLEPCHSIVIEKLKVLNQKITVKKEEESKTIKCETCALSKCIELFKNHSQQKQLSHFRFCILIWQSTIKRSMILSALLISQMNLRAIIERIHWLIIKKRFSYQYLIGWS
jgi:hypothetical protein